MLGKFSKFVTVEALRFPTKSSGLGVKFNFENRPCLGSRKLGSRHLPIVDEDRNMVAHDIRGKENQSSRFPPEW